MKKKLISLALALIMVLSLLPVTAFAAAVDAVTITPPTEYATIGAYLDGIQVAGGEIEAVFLYIVQPGNNNVDVPLSEYSKPFSNGHYRVGINMRTDNPDGYAHQYDDYEFSGTLSLDEQLQDTVVYNDEGFSVEDNWVGKHLMVVYNLYITHTHEKDTHHDAVAATCEKDGTVEYWECKGCDKYLDKDAKELESIVDPKTGHNFIGDAVYNNDGTHSFKCVNGDCNAVGVENDKDSVERCADDNADHKCDGCNRVMSECMDEDGDGICDYEGCRQSMPTEPECELPGFIGWIVNSMLRVVRLIIARITLENLKPAIIGGAIVKIIEEIVTK